MEKVGGEENNVNTEDKPVSSNSESKDSGENSVAPASSEPVKSTEEHSVDWFEPLEEDYEDEEDGQSCDRESTRDAEMESLAGESERSNSEKNSWRRGGGAVGGRGRGKRRNFAADEGWEDCSVLGEGWKRKEVLRRSGMSVGQKDVYYLSPEGDRLRSRIELLKYIGNKLDLTKFDYKTGLFSDFEPVRRHFKKRKKERSSPIDGGFSSESSFHNDTADTQDRTYSPGPPFALRPFASQSTRQSWGQKDSFHSPSKIQKDPSQYVSPSAAAAKQSVPSDAGVLSQTLTVSSKPQDQFTRISSKAILGICKRCRNSFTALEGQTMCEKCSEACSASKDDRKITFRKWLPCGFCRACQLTEDCGMCGSCVNGKSNPRCRKPVRCRKRKCLCPSLKRKAEEVMPAPQLGSILSKPEGHLSERSVNTVLKSQTSGFKESQQSDSDDQSPFADEDDDHDNEEFVRKFRRQCGRCTGCMSKEDCGICDYCIDKPKFGGSNKKRQKCRQRQCQSEMKTWIPRSRPRILYCYGSSKNKEKLDFEISDNERDPDKRMKSSSFHHLERDRYGSMNYNGQEMESETNQVVAEDLLLRQICEKWPKVEDKTTPEKEAEESEEDDIEPTITQIFSLGDEEPGDNNLDLELLELLASLRDTVLPVLWCVVLAEGPCLQLLQCSKLSAMADTVVQIEPSFRYHISVQGQPLLPTHKLYHDHPAHLTSVAQVYALLEDLERYSVCRGFKRDIPLVPEPIIQVRAATCAFLVGPEDQRCSRCKNPELVQ